MKRYNYEKMGKTWGKQAKTVTEKGVFIAHSGNWDLWEHDGTIYSIPVPDSGAGASVWCRLSRLRHHLYYLHAACGYDSLIPADWRNVNIDFLQKHGITNSKNSTI